MNAATGEWMLKRVVIRYSETGGSSLGTRFYFRHLLESWKEKNPQVEVSTVHSQYEHPQVKAEWQSGETHETSMANLKPKQIDYLLNFYRNSHGPNLYLRHGGPRCWTERRSIQGLWQPSLESCMKSLKWFHRKAVHSKSETPLARTLKYSPTSIKLAELHQTGLGTYGRWGKQYFDPNQVTRVGFDKEVLNETFSNPFSK